MVAEGVFVTGMFASYCTVDDVLRLVAGYDLSALGTAEEVAGRIRALLGPTRAGIDGAAGRDFLFHPRDQRSVDGTGSDRISLAQLGVSPVVRVESLSVDGQEIPQTEYAWYSQEGTLRLKPGGRLSGRFPAGVQNVTLVLDWGYFQPPVDIRVAQAKLVGAELLAAAAGDRGSVESLRLGDYAISYSAGGEHAACIKRWVEEAHRIASSYRVPRLMAV